MRTTPPALPGMISIAGTGDCDHLAVGYGAVWAGRDEVARIDPQTNQTVARIPLAALALGYRIGGLAVGEGAVWVVAGSGSPIAVAKIDPKTNAVLAKVSVVPPPSFSRRAPRNLAVGEGAVWVMISQPGNVYRLDPQTGQVTATIPLGKTSGFRGSVAVAEGAVWVGQEKSLFRIDPQTNRRVSELPIFTSPFTFSGGRSITAGAGAVWVASADGMVYRIDPHTDRVAATIPVTAKPPFGGIFDLAAGEALIWVAGVDSARARDYFIAGIDPKTNQIVRRIPFGAGLERGATQIFLAATKDVLWACKPGQPVWRIPLPLP